MSVKTLKFKVGDRVRIDKKKTFEKYTRSIGPKKSSRSLKYRTLTR